MNTGRWSKLKELFRATLEKEPVERAVFLEEACGEDSGLREEVECLLGWAEEGEALEQSPLEGLSEPR